VHTLTVCFLTPFVLLKYDNFKENINKVIAKEKYENIFKGA